MKGIIVDTPAMKLACVGSLIPLSVNIFRVQSQRRTKMNDPLWNEIDDKEMYPVCRILNDDGIITFASCCGNLRVEHKEGWPWVNCRISDDYNKEDILNVLRNAGYSGFSIKEVQHVIHAERPLREDLHFWNLEFWSNKFAVTHKGEKHDNN